MKNFRSFILLIVIAIFSNKIADAQISFTHNYNGSTCTPVLVNFINTSNLPPNTYYEWSFQYLPWQYTVNASANFIYGGNQNVRLTAYDTVGGSWTYLGDFDMDIIIQGSPKDFSIDPSDKKACINDDFTFKFTEKIASNFSWDFGDASPFATTQETTHSYSSLGQKIIRLSFITSCGSDVLFDTIDIVSNRPINLSWFGVDDTACPNTPINLGASADGAATYTWVLGDGNTSTNENFEHIYSTIGQKNVSLKLSNGCAANLDTTIFDIVQILGNLPYTDQLTTEVNPNPACPGDIVNFIAMGNDGTTISYEWNFGDGGNADEAFATHSFSTTGIKPVSVIGTNGCGNQGISSIIVNVQNNAIPNLAPNGNSFAGQYGVISGNDNKLGSGCIGDSITFFIFGDFNNLNWDFGDGTNSSSVRLTTLIFPFGNIILPISIIKHAYTGNGTYYPVLTLYNSCGNSAKDTIQVNIGNNGISEATFLLLPPANGGDYNYTPCEEFIFQAFEGQQYDWDFGDGTTLSTTNTITKHTFASPGNYTVKLTGANGCGYVSTETLDMLILSNNSPNADFTADVTSGVAPLTVNFSNNSTNGSNYVWNFGDGIIDSSGIINPSHTYNFPGVYTVQLDITNSCGASDNKTKLNYITANTISIGGTVFIDTIIDTAIAGVVFLFRKNANGLFDSLGSASINSNGYYQFNAALAGQYYVLAKVNKILYPNTLPTYFINKTKWFNADKITINQSKLNNDIYVQLLPSTIPTGTGRIYGNVIQGASSGKTGKVQGPGDPFNGIDVSLIDKSTGSSVAQQTSGENSGNDGGFDFTNVTNDTFGIYVDVTGVPTDAGFEIPINASNQSVYVAIIVDSNLISYNTSNIEDVKKSHNVDNFVVYPNPYKDFTNIIYTLKETANVKLEVFSILGERVSIINKNRQTIGTYRYKFSGKALGLSEGMYIIRLETDGNVLSQKVLEIN